MLAFVIVFVELTMHVVLLLLWLGHPSWLGASDSLWFWHGCTAVVVVWPWHLPWAWHHRRLRHAGIVIVQAGGIVVNIDVLSWHWPHTLRHRRRGLAMHVCAIQVVVVVVVAALLMLVIG